MKGDLRVFKDKRICVEVSRKRIFDKQEFMVRKCIQAIETKKEVLTKDSFFDKIQNARMYFYGYVECLRDCDGLNEKNVRVLQKHILAEFKAGGRRA